MTERNGTTVDIHLLDIEMKFVQHIRIHGGKCFVDFPQINVVLAYANPVEDFAEGEIR
jgi:hypothetical protein